MYTFMHVRTESGDDHYYVFLGDVTDDEALPFIRESLGDDWIDEEGFDGFYIQHRVCTDDKDVVVVL